MTLCRVHSSQCIDLHALLLLELVTMFSWFNLSQQGWGRAEHAVERVKHNYIIIVLLGLVAFGSLPNGLLAYER